MPDATPILDVQDLHVRFPVFGGVIPRKQAEVRAVAADDERPALEVLAAAGMAAGVEDPREHLVLDRAIGEPANRALGGDRGLDRAACPALGHGLLCWLATAKVLGA